MARTTRYRTSPSQTNEFESQLEIIVPSKITIPHGRAQGVAAIPRFSVQQVEPAGESQ